MNRSKCHNLRCLPFDDWNDQKRSTHTHTISTVRNLLHWRENKKQFKRVRENLLSIVERWQSPSPCIQFRSIKLITSLCVNSTQRTAPEFPIEHFTLALNYTHVLPFVCKIACAIFHETLSRPKSICNTICIHSRVHYTIPYMRRYQWVFQFSFSLRNSFFEMVNEFSCHACDRRWCAPKKGKSFSSFYPTHIHTFPTLYSQTFLTCCIHPSSLI